jgi:porin
MSTIIRSNSARLIAALLFASVCNVHADTQDDPLTFQLVYTADVLSNLSGGISEDSAYLDNLDLVLEIDADALWGMTNTQFMLYGIYNNGAKFSETIVGDAMAVSSIETGVSAVRLYEAWVKVGIGESSEVLFGLYDLNSEFDVLESAGLFMNGAHGIGAEVSQAGLNGPSIFPITGLALRFESKISEKWRYRIAAIDGVPGDPEKPDRTTIDLSSDDGALIIGELERNAGRSRLLVGAWTYTANFDNVPFDDPAIPSSRDNGNAGLYVRGESVLFDEASKLSAFWRIGVAEGDFNVFASYVSAGINWQGIIASRPDDLFGFAIERADASSTLRDVGSDFGLDFDTHETALELTYRAPVSKRLTLQPNIQYVINPGLDPTLGNALVVGIRFEITAFDAD